MQKTIVARTGNEAVAEAMRQINPDVCAAYPITPATEIMQIFSTFVADGLVKTNLITAESEHSAMSACVGSAASGARTMTATAAQGLALMHEILYIASGLRLPIVMADVNRALSGPINIHCDHSDTMAERDSGWIQIFSENSQEAYDNLIQAVRIAEHKDVLLPAMVTTDGFIISHGMERLEMYPDEEIQKFIGEYKPAYNLLNVENPITVGSLVLTDYYMEHKRAQHEAMKNSVKVIKDIGKEFGKIFGKEYDMIEKYKIDDADYILICLGSTAGTTKVAVEELRQEGMKVGLVKIRVFRPFPAEDIVNAIKNAKSVAILDRSESLSTQAGPVATEVKAALYDAAINIPIKPYIYGLGGREIYVEQIKNVFKSIKDLKKTEPVSYLGVKE
ncbi:MAG: pyruvate ferredoxin oxidoreductase [Candidatus Goldbacteria bacterium]|nr:pyruvate ferredoxin oxidoreductase [Candidatus Goldiibacteriota bacterium]